MWKVTETQRPHIRSVEEFFALIDEIGFLPLLRSAVPGFSLYEMTEETDWWTGDTERDPWDWRTVIAASHRVAYGKLLGGNAAFVSLAWYPYLVNDRRDGYDFDARFDDGLASGRAKAIMDQFEENPKPKFSFEIKRDGGFGTEGLRGYEGVMTGLQMQTYLTVEGFAQKINRQGKGYGWRVGRYLPPEAVFGAELVRSRYGETRQNSHAAIRAHLSRLLPEATAEAIDHLLG